MARLASASQCDGFAKELSSVRSSRQLAALEALLNSSAGCGSVAPVANRLQELLYSRRTRDDVRIAAATVLHYENVLEKLEPAVRDVIAKAKPRVARELSYLLALSMAGESGRPAPDDLIRLFETSQGVLREETAIVIAGAHKPSECPPRVVNDVVGLLVAVMLDRDRDADLRGRCIEAVAYFSRDQRITAALVSLSRPEQWFWGVRGAHAREHSLPSIIDALSLRRDDPVVAQRLQQIPLEIPKLRNADRVFSEWAIDRLSSIDCYLLDDDGRTRLCTEPENAR